MAAKGEDASTSGGCRIQKMIRRLRKITHWIATPTGNEIRCPDDQYGELPRLSRLSVSADRSRAGLRARRYGGRTDLFRVFDFFDRSEVPADELPGKRRHDFGGAHPLDTVSELGRFLSVRARCVRRRYWRLRQREYAGRHYRLRGGP